MFRNKWMKLFAFLLTLMLASTFLVACAGDDDNGVDDGLGDDEGLDEGLGDDEGFDEGLDDDAGITDDPFANYDANDDVYIDENEYNTFLNDNELGFSDADLDSFGEYDLNEDALLDEDEFNALVREGPG